MQSNKRRMEEDSVVHLKSVIHVFACNSCFVCVLPVCALWNQSLGHFVILFIVENIFWGTVSVCFILTKGFRMFDNVMS